MGRHLLLQVLVVSFCIMLLALEPVPQGTILSIDANKELFPWLERVRSCWEGISFRYEWDFPGSLFLPGPRELSKQFLPEDLAKALTKEVQVPYFPSGVETTTSECVPVTWLSHIHRGIATASNSWSQTCKRERADKKQCPGWVFSYEKSNVLRVMSLFLCHGSLLLNMDLRSECLDYPPSQSAFLLLIFYVVPMSPVGQGGARDANWRVGAFAAWQLDDFSVRCVGCSSKSLSFASRAFCSSKSLTLIFLQSRVKFNNTRYCWAASEHGEQMLSTVKTVSSLSFSASLVLEIEQMISLAKCLPDMFQRAYSQLPNLADFLSSI